MRLLYSDGVSMARSGPIQLLRLEHKWYVAGPGFICAVEGEEEGTKLVLKLRAARNSGESLLTYLGYRINGNGINGHGANGSGTSPT